MLFCPKQVGPPQAHRPLTAAAAGLVVLFVLLQVAPAHAQAPTHPLLGQVSTDLQDDGCTSAVEAVRSEDYDVGYANLFYFFQNRHAFSTIATNDPENPGDILTIPESSVAGAFVPDEDRGSPGRIFEYTWTDSEGNSILRVRATESGQTTDIGPTPVPAGTMITDLAYNRYTGTLWGYATDCDGMNVLGEVNMETGLFSPTGYVTGPTCMVAGTILPGGMHGLALDTEQNRLWRFNLYGSYDATPLGEEGTIGYNAAFMQSLDYSELRGSVHVAAIHSLRGNDGPFASDCARAGAPQGQLRSVDVDSDGNPTGTTTLIGLISSNGRAQAMYYTFPHPEVVSDEPTAAGEPAYALSAVHPNPVAAESVMILELRSGERVTATVYDLTGRRITTLHDGFLAPGRHRLALETGFLAGGVYLVHVRGESFNATRRAVVL